MLILNFIFFLSFCELTVISDQWLCSFHQYNLKDKRKIMFSFNYIYKDYVGF